MLSERHHDQLKAWFASGRRTLDEFRFEVSVEAVFAEAPSKGALGVDFVEATKPTTRVDLGPTPAAGFRKAVRALSVEQRMSEGIGGAVWDCGRVAVAMLHRLPECSQGRFLPGTRVLELGTGTAVVGIACWLRGGAVTLTDRHDALARRNVAAAVGDHADLEVKTLVWGSDVSSLQPPFDIVVVSDCLYDVTALPSLLETLLAVTDAASVVYVVYKRRMDERERPFFLELERHFATVAFVDRSDDNFCGVHFCRLASRKECTN